ncbi:unnamed protein product [Musa acuminata subsp. malaccensis]|uniref:(wild Malaysian banana) hypothetical protein n=1 Tax=Musa acuminata subsp. malaccensis TaxID=214687 RepID=A0A8D6ZUV2_MUSAM|nr:unnamed protein product [Musa acuminata subsp. malaccensis]
MASMGSIRDVMQLTLDEDEEACTYALHLAIGSVLPMAPQGRHRARATGDHRQGRPRRHARPSRHRGPAANRKPAGCSNGGQDPPTARRLQRCQLHRRGRRRRPPLA